MSEIIRVRRGDREMIALPIAPCRDARLSFTARGLYAYLHTLAEGTQLSGDALAGWLDTPADVDAALAELKTAGYLDGLAE